jgi:hypothetical protein
VIPAKPLAPAALALLVMLCGCGGKPAATHGAEAQGAPEAPGYLAPPMPDAIQPSGAGWRLSGTAPPGARLRLATPQGEALAATADAQGRWSVVLAPNAEPRIFGLSANDGGRQVQSEGYVLVGPQGQAAVLRSGAGAKRIDRPKAPGLRALDFDQGGGLEISAAAGPGATLIVELDGRQVAEGKTDADGRYVVVRSPANSTRVPPGAHRVQVSGDGVRDAVSFQISPPQPLAQGPLRSQLTPAGLRVDWLTPGGGVQSTILVH